MLNSKFIYAKDGSIKAYDTIKKEGLDKLGLNQRTEFIDVKTPKKSFRINRINVLDNKRKYPNRKYYTAEHGGGIYFVNERGTLYRETLEGKTFPFRPGKTKLNYGEYG